MGKNKGCVHARAAKEGYISKAELRERTDLATKAPGARARASPRTPGRPRSIEALRDWPPNPAREMRVRRRLMRNETALALIGIHEI
jgi:hypothetical protein